MAKASAEQFSLSGDQFMGREYKPNDFDCQDFVEHMMKEVGIKDNLPGSNAWYRKMTWVGTPAECIKKFGSIPKGALLYILKQDGKEPEKYKGDGIGNASHIGVKTGRTAEQMLAKALSGMSGTSARKDFRTKCSHGDGAIHSSASRGCVCTSTFNDKEINGGWNRIGLWDAFTYGDHIDQILSGKKGKTVTEQTKPEANYTQMEVYADNGAPVNLRKEPDRNSDRISKMPVGTIVEAGAEENGWRPVKFGATDGWVMAAYLRPPDTGVATVTITRAELEKVYDTIGDWLGLRG